MASNSVDNPNIGEELYLSSWTLCTWCGSIWGTVPHLSWVERESSCHHCNLLISWKGAQNFSPLEPLTWICQEWLSVFKWISQHYQWLQYTLLAIWEPQSNGCLPCIVQLRYQASVRQCQPKDMFHLWYATNSSAWFSDGDTVYKYWNDEVSCNIYA